MPKIDLETISFTNRTGYPAEHARAVAGRWYRRLAPEAGLSHFGASHVVLKPGAWSSQRHWHKGEDELLVMLTGEAVLVEDHARTVLRPGEVAAFAAGVANGHHLVNESQHDCCFLVVGAGEDIGGEYSDIDIGFTETDYLHKDGTPYPSED